jgi:hypothetical protein
MKDVVRFERKILEDFQGFACFLPEKPYSLFSRGRSSLGD